MPTHAQAGVAKRGVAAALFSALLLSTAVQAAPPIRTSADNRVPACVSPDRLMAFLRDRNDSLDPRYAEIARWYKHYGDAWRVRWDYAFFQMVLETNYLKFRRGDGTRGDVHERQNNFAGIGATGGGVPGERFADIKTGVHAQIQHLVAYSGESVAEPVAKRTRENQDDIIALSKRLGRAVTFGDLARRWAVDRQYAKNIDFVAGQFRDGYCKGPAVAQDVPVPQPVSARRFPKPSGLGGPKPQMLAGPQDETLPWRDQSNSVAQAAPAPPAGTPPQPAQEEPKRAGPPVRTLWSREKGAVPEEAKSAPATPQSDAVAGAPVREQGSQRVAIPNEQARPAGSITEETPAAADDGPVELPTFRIAPRTPEPSKLGGPVDAPAQVAMPAPRNLPSGTFVEMDPPAHMTQALNTVPPAAAEVHSHSQGVAADNCRIVTASYGGTKTLLVQSDAKGVLQLTALTVLDGFEKSMLASYAKASAPGARIIAEYRTKADALAEAQAICPPK